MEKRKAEAPVYSAENPDTSLSSGFRYALDQPLENMATTFQALGMEGWETFMRDLIEEPEHYEAAAGKFIGEQGEDFNWEYFPRALFEQAGQIAGSLATRGAGTVLGGLAGGPTGALAGALIGPGLFEALQLAGPIAYERASNAKPPRAEPNWDDWKGSLSAAAFSGALNAVGIRNVGVLNNIGKGALKQAGKGVAKAGLSEGVTETLQGLTEQVGGTALTDQGLEINPKAAFGEGLLGAGAGTTTQTVAEGMRQVVPVEEAVVPVEEAVVPVEEAPLQIEDQRPAEEVLMEQLYGEMETEAQKTPTLRKYIDPLSLSSLLIRDGFFLDGSTHSVPNDRINEAYERLAQEIQGQFKTKDVPKENRGPILQEILEGIKAEPDLYVTPPAYRQDSMVSTQTPDNFFKTDDIFFGMVTPKIAALKAGVEPAVEQTNLFETDQYTRTMYNEPNFTASSPERGGMISSSLPVGRVNRMMSDDSIGLYMGEGNKLGFYPDKIDPLTLSHSVLRKHLTTIKKDGSSRYGIKLPIGDPDKLYQALFLDKNALGFPVPKKGLSNPKNKKIALQAIDSGVAQRLLDLKTQGLKVEVAELDRIIDDHYSRFQHTHITDGNSDAFKAAELKNLQSYEGTPELGPAEATLLGEKSVEFMFEELMRSPLFKNQEEEVSEYVRGYYDNGWNAIYEDLIDLHEGNANAQQRYDSIYNSFWFSDANSATEWMTAEQIAEANDVVYPRYRERMKTFEEKELPAIIPLLAPDKKEDGAWENIGRTLHTGQQFESGYTDYMGTKYSEGFPRALDDDGNPVKESPKSPYYFKPKESVIETGINDEIWYSFNPRLSKEKEADPGALNLDARRSDPRHYDKSGGGHAVLPGTWAWTRGIMGEFGPGLFGKMVGEIQQDIYRQGQLKGPRHLRHMRFRSLSGEAKLTPKQKMAQKKLDSINNVLEARSNRGKNWSLEATAILAPLMTLELDTGQTENIEGELTDDLEMPLDLERYPRYVIKNLPARQNGVLRRMHGIGKRVGVDDLGEFRDAHALFTSNLEYEGTSVIPGGTAMSTPLLEEIALNANSEKVDYVLGITRNQLYGDWLLDDQPFRSLGRELSPQDVATYLESETWEAFFGNQAMQDTEVQSRMAMVESLEPFINHLAYQAHAPLILKEARPWAMEMIKGNMNNPDFGNVAPVVDALINPDENLTTAKIRRLEKKEQTSEVKPEDIIPDYPHQGTTYGAKGEFAKDVLHREIRELLTTYPDANVLGLHRYGTEGSPGSPYGAMITEAKKLAAENPSISIKKIAEFPITRMEGRERVQRMQEIWLLFLANVREKIILDGGVEGMMKGGLVKKATNEVLNYGDYGRSFI
jgi:hypothetical protein